MNNEGYQAVLTPSDMRETEQRAFQAGASSLLLMEHAAQQVVLQLQKALGGTACGKKALFLCGPGNNGGDGLAAARLWLDQGGEAEIWLSAPPKTPDANTNFQMAKALGIPIFNWKAVAEEGWPDLEYMQFDGFVDAMLGTGFGGAPRGILGRMIELLSALSKQKGHGPIVAVDIPSGIDGKTGEAPGSFVRADVTVTFHAAKPGLFLTPHREAMGKIVVADIGLNQWAKRTDILNLPEEEQEVDCALMLPELLRKLPERGLSAHKGESGRIAIYAGSLGMAGAAAMCAEAAVTAGAGLTTLLCPREIIPILQGLVPCAMCRDAEEAKENPPDYDVLVMGPGLSQQPGIWEKMLAFFDPAKKSVWDADALNLLADHPFPLGERAVMTPHPGEAARLLGWPLGAVLGDRLGAAKALCEKYGCIVILKSDVSVIAAKMKGKIRFILNASGSPALAKGGSGDVLAGIMGVLAHEKLPLWEAAAMASLWHGLAGQVGAKKYGQRQLNARQVITCLGEAERWGRGEEPSFDAE